MATKVAYSDDYVEKLFQYWYANGSPIASEFIKMIERDNVVDEHGRHPTETTVDMWFYEKGFRARKDLLDARVATQIDDDLVALKVNMLKEQAAGFRAIRQKAEKFLLETDFDSSSAAVNAFIRSSQEERVALGLSKTIQKLAALDDDGLVEQVRQLAARVSGDIIDMDDVEDKDTEQ